MLTSDSSVAIRAAAAPARKPLLAPGALIAAIVATVLLISATTGIPGVSSVSRLFDRATTAGFGLVVASETDALRCGLGGALPAGVPTCQATSDLTAAVGDTTLSFHNSGGVNAHIAVTVGSCRALGASGGSACNATELSIEQALTGQQAHTLVAPTALARLTALGAISFATIPPGATLSVWWRHSTVPGATTNQATTGADQQVAWQFAQ